MQLLSAVDCQIEEMPDHSIIVEGLQQWGDRSLARKHVAQKADKWNLIQTLPCCVSQKDRQADVDWFFFIFFFFSISPPAVPGFQTTDIPNIWMLTQQMQNEWHTLRYKWNHVNLLCCFSHSYCTTEGLQLFVFLKLLSKTNTNDYAT